MENKICHAMLVRVIAAQNEAQKVLSDVVVRAAMAAKLAEGTIAADATNATALAAAEALDKEISALQAMQEVDNPLKRREF